MLILNLALTAETARRSRAQGPSPAGWPAPAVILPAEGEDSLEMFAADGLARLRPAPDPAAVSRRLIENKEQ